MVSPLIFIAHFVFKLSTKIKNILIIDFIWFRQFLVNDFGLKKAMSIYYRHNIYVKPNSRNFTVNAFQAFLLPAGTARDQGRAQAHRDIAHKSKRWSIITIPTVCRVHSSKFKFRAACYFDATQVYFIASVTSLRMSSSLHSSMHVLLWDIIAYYCELLFMFMYLLINLWIRWFYTSMGFI